MSGQDRIRVLAVVCIGLLLFLIMQEWNGGMSWLSVWIRGPLLMVVFFWATVTLHISVTPACRYSPASLLILQYLFQKLMRVLEIYFSRKLESQTIACQASQEEFLLTTLANHANTAYGRDHNFKDIASVASFRDQHPLTLYDHYASYMERVARGEQNVIIPRALSRLALTSGTTGKQKMIGQSKKHSFLFIFKHIPIGMTVLRSNFAPNHSPLLKTCYFYTHCHPDYSVGGTPVGSTTMINLPDIFYRLQYSTPPAGMRLTNEDQAMYVHLLFALRDPDLQVLFSIFATTIYCGFLKLEADWRKLTDDLRRGRIGDHVGLDRDVKAVLESELRPEPARADQLEREFEKGFDGIAKRIWPGMSSIWGVCSGAMTVYGQRLEEKYTKGLPIVSMLYNSTESLVGIQYNTGPVPEYLALPGDVFYEFIPLDHSHEDQPDTLLAEEVTVGQLYELALTTLDGLCRYRMGDVIKVAGFYNKAPMLDYQYRSGDLLNLNGEKTPEISVRGAINDTLAQWDGLDLADYACVESTLYEESVGVKSTSRTAYYVIILEVNGIQDNKLDKNKITSEVDDNLRLHADRYNHHRIHESIAPPQLVFVQPRSFAALRDWVLEHSGASRMQVKIPRLLRKAEVIRLLAEREIK